MVNRVINRRPQRAYTVLHLHLGILKHHGSSGQQRQCIGIVHLTWHAAARSKRHDSHRCPQHSPSIGLVHSTSCRLHLTAILTPVCLQHKCLKPGDDIDPKFSLKVVCPMITTSPPPGAR